MSLRVAKPPILDRLPAGGGVIQASAGTGKTHTLEHLVVELILQGRKLEEILVVTFTEKATLEIRTRIRRLLERLLQLEAPGPEVEGPAWVLTPEAQEVLGRALRGFDRAAIATIHGFCRQVLQDSAFEGGSLFHQELADGQTLFRQAFRDLLRTDFSRGEAAALLRQVAGAWSPEAIASLLWAVHRERAAWEPDPAAFEGLVAAFPRELLDRREALLAALEGVPHAVVVTATRKAAIKRLDALLQVLASTPEVAAVAEALRTWGTGTTGAKSREGVRRTCEAAGGEAVRLGAWVEQALAVLPGVESRLVRGLLAPVQERLRALKAEGGLYDFDDMVLRVREALLDGPQGAALARRLGERFRVALIDEFQDTDEAQWDIFRRVFLDQGLPLYVIGDPKQGIYGFRGGDLPTYHKARQALLGEAPPAELTENHRSTPEVIAAYNHLLTHEEPPFFQAPNYYPIPVACARPDLAFLDASGARLAPVQVVALRQAPTAAARRAVAHTLAEEIRDLILGGACLGPADPLQDPAGRATHRLSFRHVQVLAAKRKEGLQVAEALREAGVPCAFYKQDGLFQSEEAEDLLDVLRAIERPRDPGCLARALVTPFFGYPLTALEGLPALAEDHPVRERLHAWQELARARAFPQLLDQLIHDSGLAARLRLTRPGDRALTNHLHLAEVLGDAARERTRDLADLVRLLSQWVQGAALPPGENGNLQRLEAEPDAVQILTMHQSKGLEAPVVALFGFSGPDRRLKVHRFHLGGERRVWLGPKGGPREALIEDEEDREAERLMYVALTRAKARLILPCVIHDEAADGGLRPVHPAGVTRALNPVLRAVVEAGSAPHLFQVCGLRRQPGERPDRPARPDLSAFAPPVFDHGESPAYEALRALARPILTTSYTHLSSWVKHRQAEQERGLERHQDQDQPRAALPPGDLPGGAGVGQLMHTLLEEVDLDALRGASFEAWWTPARRAWVAQVLGRFGVEVGLAELAARRVFQAVHAPLPGPGGDVGSLLDHDPGRLAREMDFLAPYFETRDFMNGAMDAVFQRGGRTHVLDWKNDLLASYGPEALTEHVWHRYAIQIKLYTWVILRWLRVEGEAEYEAQFGGLHYVFLRGLPDQGVWHHRPSWAEVQGWKDDLLRLHGEVTHG